MFGTTFASLKPPPPLRMMDDTRIIMHSYTCCRFDSPHQRLAAGSTKLPITTLDITLRQIVQQTIKRRILRKSCLYGLRRADNIQDLDVVRHQFNYD